MALDKTMAEVWDEWVLEFGHREGWWNWDFADKITGLKACQMSTESCRRCIWIVVETNNRIELG